MPKNQTRTEPWVVRFLAGVFSSVPLALAGALLAIGLKVKNPWFRRSFFAASIILSIAGSLSFNRVQDFLLVFFLSGTGNPSGGTALKLGLFYFLYVIVSLPVFLVIAYLGSHEKLFKGDSVKRDPGPFRMRHQRHKSTHYQTFLGESFSRNHSLFLTNEQREMHMQVVGSTGTGKTESVLLPMLTHDINHGKGAIVIDGKGDLELLDRIHYSVSKRGRLKDFYFFSLAHPKGSNTYNPLLRGNATELKDKIVGSMVWSEEFYRRMAEQAALSILNALLITGRKITFRTLHACLTDIKSLQTLSDDTGPKDAVLQRDLVTMINNFKSSQKFLSGLMADLYLSSRSEFSDLLDVEEPDIDLLKLYQENKIAYFALDLQGYGDTAKRMGRMILQDLKTVSSYIQSNVPASKRRFFPVFIDDAASFLDLGFVDFLNKSRASRIAIALFHQSLADLFFRAAPNFQQQVIENTNVKIILRQDDPFAVEKFAKIAGTRRTLIPTYQTEESFTGKGLTGTGSVREGQTFRIEPDLIRALKRGEAIVIWKTPGFLAEHIKLDFFGHPPYPGIFKPLRAEKSGRKEAAAKVTLQPEKPKIPEGTIPPDVIDPLSFIREIETKPANKQK